MSSIFHSPSRMPSSSVSSSTSSSSSPSRISPRKYFSRKFSSRISWHELPLEKNARGITTPIGIFFLAMRLMVPLAYIYILLIILRELCITFPDTFYTFLQNYTPPFASIMDKMQKSSIFVEIWVIIEALFYIVQISHIRYLQYKDPLEASLSAAPIATIDERYKLMNQMLHHITDGDPIDFIRGWFFDEKLEHITRYDVIDFFTWCLFEGRNQEHLTMEEVNQLNWFIKDFECQIGIYLYGALEVEEDDDNEANEVNDVGVRVESSESNTIYFKRSEEIDDEHITSSNVYVIDNNNDNDDDDEFQLLLNRPNKKKRKQRPKEPPSKKKKQLQPKKHFQFSETAHDTSQGYFTNLYENYNQKYQQYKQEMQHHIDQSSVQNIKNFVSNKRQQLVEVEEHAMAAASHMYEHAYFTFIQQGGTIDKRMKSLSLATHQQLNDTWNSVGKMKERLETAQFLSSRKRFLQQQNKGYRMLLERIIHTSSVPTRQMVDLMKKITQCNESLEMIEDSATDSFLKVTGFARKHLLQQKEPQRYAKYTEDELLGLAIYPLAFNLMILGLTDGLLRVMMSRRGFERLNIGTTVYYYHRGRAAPDYSDHDGVEDQHLTPIVFCHGIGIGLGYYLSLVDELLELGRPLFLPEIPYVCGFRPWISRKSILTPPAVVSTLTAMLASHGNMKASFIGHSYGTSWLSYMCKYASDTVASVMFLDPICFCLHLPCLTKSFVYHRADPGSISYMVKTDVIINWTIQRSFPWARIILFVEDIPNIPCSVYISEHDALIPADAVQKYFKSKDAHFSDEMDASDEHFKKGPINVTIFRGDIHGDWTERPSTAKRIANTARILTEQYESKFAK